MAAALSQFKSEYIRTFPAELTRKAGQSFVASVALNLLLLESATVAAGMGAVAVIATVVEAVVRPIIRSIFPNTPIMVQAFQILTAYCVVSANLIEPVFSLLPSIEIVSSPVLSLLGMVAGWAAFNGETWYDENRAMVVVL